MAKRNQACPDADQQRVSPEELAGKIQDFLGRVDGKPSAGDFDMRELGNLWWRVMTQTLPTGEQAAEITERIVGRTEYQRALAIFLFIPPDQLPLRRGR